MPIVDVTDVGVVSVALETRTEGARVDLEGTFGVFYPGKTGYATEENSSLSTTFNPAKPDRTLEAEYAALAALGGLPAFGLPVGTLGAVVAEDMPGSPTVGERGV